MNQMTKRLEALEAVADEQSGAGKPQFFVIRRLIAPETKDEPMNFALCAGQQFMRGGDETEDEFGARIERETIAKFGTSTAYQAILSASKQGLRLPPA